MQSNNKQASVFAVTWSLEELLKILFIVASMNDDLDICNGKTVTFLAEKMTTSKIQLHPLYIWLQQRQNIHDVTHTREGVRD
jgi:hypothetical protein